MEKRDKIEIYVGGIFGVIAIAAAIIEYCLGDSGALAGCIKDIASTLVVVVLLLASIQFRAKNLIGKLTSAVNNWGIENAPLIFKAIEYEPAKGSNFEQGFKLLQDPQKYIQLINDGLNPKNPEWVKYAKYNSRGYNYTGKFINLPSYKYMTEYDFDVLIVMNQSHFKNSERDFNTLIEDIKKAFNAKFESTGKSNAYRTGSALEFTIHYKKIRTNEDIVDFVDTLDFVLSLVKVIA